jgi:hypothetical protein
MEDGEHIIYFVFFRFSSSLPVPEEVDTDMRKAAKMRTRLASGM